MSCGKEGLGSEENEDIVDCFCCIHYKLNPLLVF